MPNESVTEKANAMHTPGPWKVGAHVGARVLKHDNAIEIQDANGGMVACLYQRNRSMNEIEDKANARLIAAAPEMLAALKAAYTNLADALHGRRPTMNDLSLSALMSAALAKAEGGAK